MKPTEFIVENSIIAQEADDMYRDHEVQMARSQMYSAAQAAIEIHRLLRDVSEMEGLEGWVQSKLTLASQYLESVRDYMKYEAVSQEPEMMVFAESAADYAIDQLLVEDDYNDAIKDFFARGGQVEKLPAKKPRKSEKTDFSSRHISGKGEVGRGKAGRIGKSAKTNPKGKPVVTAEDDELQVRKPGGDYVDPDKGYAASTRREKIMRAEPEKINPMLQKHAERSTPRAYGDPGIPGAKEITGPRGAGVRDFTNKGLSMGGGSSVGVARPEGVPKVSRMPTTPFGGGGGGGGMNPFEKRRSLYFEREEVYPDNKKPPIEDRTKKLKERLSNLERKIKEQAPNANLADTGFQQGASTVKAAPGQIQKDIQASNQLGGALGSVQSLRQGGPNTIANIAPGAQAKVAGMQQDKAVVDKRLAIAGVGQTPTAPQPAQKTDFSQYKDDDVSESKKNKKLREMATGGSSSSSGMATSMSGPAHKATSGVPKRVGNSYKSKRVAVGKGVYDK